MKSKSIWLGISLTLFMTIAKAENEQVTYTEDGREILVIPEADGSITVTSSDGRTIRFSKTDAEIIKSINFEDLPKFEGGRPCARYNSQK